MIELNEEEKKTLLNIAFFAVFEGYRVGDAQIEPTLKKLGATDEMLKELGEVSSIEWRGDHE